MSSLTTKIPKYSAVREQLLAKKINRFPQISSGWMSKSFTLTEFTALEKKLTDYVTDSLSITNSFC